MDIILKIEKISLEYIYNEHIKFSTKFKNIKKE